MGRYRIIQIDFHPSQASSDSFSSVSGKMRHRLGFGVDLAQSNYFIEQLDKALKEANMWLRGAKQGSQGG